MFRVLPRNVEELAVLNALYRLSSEYEVFFFFTFESRFAYVNSYFLIFFNLTSSERLNQTGVYTYFSVGLLESANRGRCLLGCDGRPRLPEHGTRLYRRA